jgi:ribosomal protein L40E
MGKNKDPNNTSNPHTKTKTIRKQKICFKCGENVAPDATECPKCGVTGESSPLWMLKITIGFILGFMLWLMFWR